MILPCSGIVTVCNGRFSKMNPTDDSVQNQGKPNGHYNYKS